MVKLKTLYPQDYDTEEHPVKMAVSVLKEKINRNKRCVLVYL